MDKGDEALLRNLLGEQTPKPDDDQDAALLRDLRSHRTTRSPRDEDDPALLSYLREVEPSASSRDEAEVGLRSLGFNYRERDAFLRPGKKPRASTQDRHRAIQVKRFRWHLGQRLDSSISDETLTYLVGEWVDLSQADLELALAWWDAGADPARPEIVSDLIEAGLQPKDLARPIGNRTVLEHLRRGSSVEWCIAALGWNRRGRQARTHLR